MHTETLKGIGPASRKRNSAAKPAPSSLARRKQRNPRAVKPGTTWVDRDPACAPSAAASAGETSGPHGAGAAGESHQLPTTLVLARIDVGFGNVLYIRGQGDGLNWEKGTPLACMDSSIWVWSTDTLREAAEFKLLLNDEQWAQGENLTIRAGQRVDVNPAF